MKEEQDAKFVIERTYPALNPPLHHHGVNKRIVNLEITSEKPLPDEFFTELSELVNKHQK